MRTRHAQRHETPSDNDQASNGETNTCKNVRFDQILNFVDFVLSSLFTTSRTTRTEAQLDGQKSIVWESSTLSSTVATCGVVCVAAVFRVWRFEFRIWGLKFGIQYPGCGFMFVRCKFQCLGLGFQCEGFQRFFGFHRAHFKISIFGDQVKNTRECQRVTGERGGGKERWPTFIVGETWTSFRGRQKRQNSM